MTVSLAGVGTTYADSLPLAIKLCVDTDCTTFALKSTGEAGMLECENATGGDEVCTIDGMGTVVVSALPLPDGIAPGRTLSVSATITPKTGATYASTQSVTVTGTSSCGGCTSAGVAFSP